jgi:hypothetical protein
LVKKCRELNTEIVGNAAKVQTALKLSEEDQQTIVALKKEIEKAWKMVDASHEKVRECGQLCMQATVHLAGQPAWWTATAFSKCWQKPSCSCKPALQISSAGFQQQLNEYDSVDLLTGCTCRKPRPRRPSRSSKQR